MGREKLSLKKYLNKNHAEKLDITYKDIEKQVAKYTYRTVGKRNYITERGKRFPPFNKPFYKFIYENKRIPTLDEYHEFYLASNEGNKTIQSLTEELHRDFKGRLFRTHPSFLRDIHMAKKIKALTDLEVVFNVDLDLRGIDILIPYNNKYYCIHNFFDSKRSKDFRLEKNGRHEDVIEDHTVINVPYRLGSGILLGKGKKFELYSEKHFLQILNSILKDNLN